MFLISCPFFFKFVSRSTQQYSSRYCSTCSWRGSANRQKLTSDSDEGKCWIQPAMCLSLFVQPCFPVIRQACSATKHLSSSKPPPIDSNHALQGLRCLQWSGSLQCPPEVYVVFSWDPLRLPTARFPTVCIFNIPVGNAHRADRSATAFPHSSLSN